MINENLNELDVNLHKARKIVDNFSSFEAELGQKKALRAVSEFLTAADHKIMSLTRDMNIPNTEYMKRRQHGGLEG